MDDLLKNTFVIYYGKGSITYDTIKREINSISPEWIDNWWNSYILNKQILKIESLDSKLAELQKNEFVGDVAFKWRFKRK